MHALACVFQHVHWDFDVAAFADSGGNRWRGSRTQLRHRLSCRWRWGAKRRPQPRHISSSRQGGLAGVDLLAAPAPQQRAAHSPRASVAVLSHLQRRWSRSRAAWSRCGHPAARQHCEGAARSVWHERRAPDPAAWQLRPASLPASAHTQHCRAAETRAAAGCAGRCRHRLRDAYAAPGQRSAGQARPGRSRCARLLPSCSTARRQISLPCCRSSLRQI